MEIAIFWVIKKCSTEISRRFGGTISPASSEPKKQKLVVS
jgi:hypothetical protein